MEIQPVTNWGNPVAPIGSFSRSKSLPPPAFYAKLDSLPGAHAIIQPLNENYSFDAENEAGGQKGGQNEDSKTTQKTTQKILDAISNSPNVTRLELSEICGITADGVKWQLKSLAKSGRSH